MPLLDDYMHRDDVAKDLGVHVRTLERWHRLREGPTRTTIGRAVYYRRSDVLAWIESRRDDSCDFRRKAPNYARVAPASR